MRPRYDFPAANAGVVLAWGVQRRKMSATFFGPADAPGVWVLAGKLEAAGRGGVGWPPVVGSRVQRSGAGTGPPSENRLCSGVKYST